MSNAKAILAKKGPTVVSVGKDATVLLAAQLMNEHRIGAVVVLDRQRLVGMFTERDILRRIVADQRDPAATRVEDVMTSEVVCCQLETSVEEARAVMMTRRIRHLPVVDEQGQLLGLISIGDLNAYQVANQEQTIHTLHEYLYGRV
jgi:CBS domain-containing protein